MHRSMLNQEMTGEFMRILKWVLERSNKKYILKNKKTQKGKDINSAINIAKKIFTFVWL